jgi:uncharacterized sulfatase
VPCIIAAPEAQAGAAARGLVELIDLYPTVADYCGVQPPHELAGQSLRALLNDAEAEGKPAAFTLAARGPKQYGQAIRTARWRYIQWSDGNAELYDELNDPQENFDLAKNAAQAEVVNDLQRRLVQLGPPRKLKREPSQPVERIEGPQRTSP